jgi:hypothetical protein
LAGLFLPPLVLGDFLVALGFATLAGEGFAGDAALTGDAALGAGLAGDAALTAAALVGVLENDQ